MQHLFVLSLLIAFATIGVVVWKLGKDKAVTISLHAAKHPLAYLGLATGLTTVVAMNAAFLYGWLLVERNISSATVLLYSALMASILVTSWVPDTNGLKRLIHRQAAYAIVFLMPIVVISLLLSLTLPITAVVVVCALLLAQLYMIYLLLKVHAARDRFLHYQGIYIACFIVAMLVLIYMGTSQ